MDETQIQAAIEKRIAEIKAHMPQTYRSIQDQAAEIGREAYALVRKGLRGEPNCFWACEAGRVMGTPFALIDVQRDVALSMVAFGAEFVVIWADKGEHNGKD
jgi:hypothetical protein